MHFRLKVILVLAAVAGGLPITLSALDIFGGVTLANQRFGGTFPSTPTANPSFAFAAQDFSGVGWRTASSAFGVTMISPQHFVTAAHIAPSAGATVSFLSAGGVVRDYTVSSSFTILYPPTGAATDIAIGRLTAPLAPSDQIAFYPTLLLNTFNAYQNLPLVVYGQTGVVGTNNVEGFLVNFDLLPFGSGNSVGDSVLLTTFYNSVVGDTQGRSGDSGSPTFILVNGQLSIVGVHSAIGNAPPEFTLDSFLPSFYSDINSRLALDGYSFGGLTAIPEPGTVGFLFGLTAMAIAIFRRRAG